MSEDRRPRWSGTLWFLTAFTALVAVALIVVGVLALLDGSFLIAGLALLVALAIGIHGVARILLLSERKDQF
jgi:Flp pilus assembly protein TadB